MITRPIRCKVFLEGVQMPFHRVTLSMQANSVNQLVLELPPIRELFDIVPRTICQVYYDDGGGFKTFFEGEVVAHGIVKNPQGRQMTLVCQDLSNYWLYSYAYYITNVDPNRISREDRILYFSGADPLSAADRRQSENILPIRTLGSRADGLLRNKDIVTGIRKVLELVRDVNSFYESKFSNFKLTERLFNLPDAQIQFFIDATVIDGIADIVTKNQHAHVPIIQVITLALSSLYHTFWSLSLPSVRVDQGKVKPINFLIAPVTFLTAPPQCNVIFPNLHEGFQYIRHFMDEPTRFEIYSGSSNDGISKQFHFAPKQFRELFSKIEEGQRANKDVRTQNLVITNPDIEFDESTRGIIPAREALLQDAFMRVRSSVMASAKDHKSGEEAARTKIERFFSEVADFEYLIRKFSARRFGPITMPFNPNLHPAFPILLLDKEARIFASPESMTHMIDAEGAAATSLSCILARHKDVIPTFRLPPWINKSYIPEAIGENTFSSEDPDGITRAAAGAYPAVIGAGMQSVLSRALDIPKVDPVTKEKTTEFRKPASQEEAADALFEAWLASGDREAFITEYTTRRIQTFEESLDFLGVTPTNDEELSGALYDPKKRAVIEAAKMRLIEAGFAIVEA